jgi:hypothetical protein
MAPGSPSPNTSRPLGLCYLVGTRDSNLLALLPHRYIQLAIHCLEPAIRHISEPQVLGFAIFLAPEGFPPHRACWPSTLHCPWQQVSPCSPVKEWECQIPHWREENYKLLLCRQHQKPCSPKVHRSPVFQAVPPCRRLMSLLYHCWNPSSSTEWQSAILLLLGGLPATVHRALPTVTAGEPLHPNKEQELQSLIEGIKEVTPQIWQCKGNISNISLSEEHCWSSRRKKPSKLQLQRHKGLKP